MFSMLSDSVQYSRYDSDIEEGFIRRSRHSFNVYGYNPKHIYSSNNSSVDRTKYRPFQADVVNVPDATISWNSVQTTYDIGKGALSQRSFKRCNRSKADPWRRYGALKKLHEIGGTGCAPPNQAGIRLQQKFYTILPGTQPPPPPGWFFVYSQALGGFSGQCIKLLI
ncbi:hypothetical protein OESDEN_00735 [Oesophagostomum dentatum]|uniref:Uncharacterized protein n=1 Tax=Oesophagostomum dentatum TaxID=61180 RepID=A0A0B1TT27_OESDE|nr:hypothetical protein OESDEN_00735 [Oesophagostomum dentatum]